jgi:glutamine synthetase adenylyltransferase
LRRAIDQLHQGGHMNECEVATLENAYGTLRRCELVLRRYDNRSVSTLPSDPDEQRKFAVRLGYPELESFRRDYVDARETIHALYGRYITTASLP